jgi:hypothetical protein
MVAMSGSPPQGRELADLDPAGPDKGVQVAGGDTDVAAQLDVGDAALDGLIASDKFCWTRYGQLRLAWWRRPLRLRLDRGV